MFPDIADIARLRRAFLSRAVRFLATEAGLRQFLGIGAGLPTADNTHEVAQRAAPESRIVYVDVKNVGMILEEVSKTLDFTQPVGLTMLATAPTR